MEEPKKSLNEIVETIRKLVRPFIAVSFVLLTVYLAIKGQIEAKDILSLTGIIAAFYFGEKSALKKPGENK